jgi:hypothetical protein
MDRGHPFSPGCISNVNGDTPIDHTGASALLLATGVSSLISTLNAVTCTRMGNGTHAPPLMMAVAFAVTLSYVKLVLASVGRLNIDLDWCIMSCRAWACATV